jgi:hydroxymethylpyrimidine kinase/phosphomethylpyrimidine kinase
MFRVLSIAGSDSGGGAGIQADLKTITAYGGHGMTAVTAITAQNTMGVSGIQAIDPSLIVQQIEAVFDDIGVDVVKIGMLASPEIVQCVAAYSFRPSVNCNIRCFIGRFRYWIGHDQSFYRTGHHHHT